MHTCGFWHGVFVQQMKTQTICSLDSKARCSVVPGQLTTSSAAVFSSAFIIHLNVGHHNQLRLFTPLYTITMETMFVQPRV